jgi:hypothetical protein
MPYKRQGPTLRFLSHAKVSDCSIFDDLESFAALIGATAYDQLKDRSERSLGVRPPRFWSRLSWIAGSPLSWQRWITVLKLYRRVKNLQPYTRPSSPSR